MLPAERRERSGRIWCGDAWHFANMLGRAEIGNAYQRTLGDTIDGSIRTYENRLAPTVIAKDGRTPHIRDLLEHADEWAQALGALVRGLKGANAG